MNKLSIKLGIVFFFIIFGLETFMFFFLHNALVNSRVEEELSSLQTRGNSHRDILEDHFDKDTISHVALMESEAITDVVITDFSGHILGSSFKNNQIEQYLKKPQSKIAAKGQIVEADWENKPYIITISPIAMDKKTIGFVYMFQETTSIQSLIERLNQHFLLTGFIVLSLTFIVIIILTKALTKPLVKMKEATYQISKGNFSVTLPKTGNDELGELAESIKLLAQDLNYLKKERNDFLASISHELRTPLTYIKGYSDIVMTRDLNREDQEKYLQIIVDEANRLSSLIEDLFALAKIDKNSFVIQKQKILLNDLLKKMDLKLSPAFKEKNMSLIICCPERTYLYADPSRLEQIIINLLDNSIKYSSDDSKTMITVIPKKKTTEIIIKDNGKGIPEKDLPYIFNRFYRVEKSRKRSLGGTGLGLAIVQELVYAQGGSINVHSKLNSGTTFILTFDNKGADK
ncbi:HAMP domain-containing sensor histidine kinase [Niallia sp. 03190]|uniref:HAMP domain-containing sensor histidine kinase n=1 Tax=Niallia sp. 03190 TaxID=3458061 RepID=UPI0040445459